MQAILTMDGNTGGDFDKQDRSDHSNNLVGGLMNASNQAGSY